MVRPNADDYFSYSSCWAANPYSRLVTSQDSLKPKELQQKGLTQCDKGIGCTCLRGLGLAAALGARVPELHLALEQLGARAAHPGDHRLAYPPVLQRLHLIRCTVLSGLMKNHGKIVIMIVLRIKKGSV